MNAISLFSCIGVSEFYLKDLGIDVLVASDIDQKRCDIHQFFYPKTTMVCGDITQKNTKESIIKSVGKKKIDLIISTPPCQGLSTIGKNKGNALIETKDPRNYLIIETFDFIDKYSPSFVIFENVPQLLKIKLLFGKDYLTVEEILNQKYSDKYNINIKILNTCNYGIPQSRERVFIDHHSCTILQTVSRN